MVNAVLAAGKRPVKTEAFSAAVAGKQQESGQQKKPRPRPGFLDFRKAGLAAEAVVHTQKVKRRFANPGLSHWGGRFIGRNDSYLLTTPPDPVSR